MAKFTPGPWRFKISTTPFYTRHYIYGDRGQGLAEVYTHDDGEANARLIAAAPAMYEALKSVLFDCDNVYGSAPLTDTIKQIHAALALADGGDDE